MPTNFDVAIASFDEPILELKRQLESLTKWEKIFGRGRKIRNDIAVLEAERNTLVRHRDATGEERELVDKNYLRLMEADHIPTSVKHQRLLGIFGAKKWIPE